MWGLAEGGGGWERFAFRRAVCTFIPEYGLKRLDLGDLGVFDLRYVTIQYSFAILLPQKVAYSTVEKYGNDPFSLFLFLHNKSTLSTKRLP